jgi:hypothetical protein
VSDISHRNQLTHKSIYDAQGWCAYVCLWPPGSLQEVGDIVKNEDGTACYSTEKTETYTECRLRVFGAKMGETP